MALMDAMVPELSDSNAASKAAALKLLENVRELPFVPTHSAKTLASFSPTGLLLRIYHPRWRSRTRRVPFVVLTALIVVVSELPIDFHAAVTKLNLSKAKISPSSCSNAHNSQACRGDFF